MDIVSTVYFNPEVQAPAEAEGSGVATQLPDSLPQQPLSDLSLRAKGTSDKPASTSDGGGPKKAGLQVQATVGAKPQLMVDIPLSAMAVNPEPLTSLPNKGESSKQGGTEEIEAPTTKGKRARMEAQGGNVAKKQKVVVPPSDRATRSRTTGGSVTETNRMGVANGTELTTATSDGATTVTKTTKSKRGRRK
ncbi:hypothetical protein AAF712_010167 [Marasmius tenuissimus]|uniref:Uncharacterized protein n=1 Tax=Marasmius tenuissimus TaxID=585030 RepID=A0ABR2ZMQ0_9AGAR